MLGFHVAHLCRGLGIFRPRMGDKWGVLGEEAAAMATGADGVRQLLHQLALRKTDWAPAGEAITGYM